MSQIVVLNGTSSAGKSTIARELQRRCAEPFLHLGIDTFLPTLPERYLNSNAPGASQVLTHQDDDGAPCVEIRVGPVQHRMLLGMYHAAAALAAQGNSIVLDDVIFDERWLREAVRAFAGFQTLLVGVHCPLEVLEERERLRGDRRPGMARGLLATVHQPGIYDLELNTAELSPAESVARIRHLLDHPPASPALIRLQNLFS